jgi:ABC-type cobalamin/Fe3+-siderophores transport system ATPase subunit
VKIDIHVHTKKTKQGDSPFREVTPERFSEIVLSTDVKIVAITNHNVFDIEQYEQILKQVDGAIQVWPGIELDIEENDGRAHLIVIVSPDKKTEFYDAVISATSGFSPDNFSITLNDVAEYFDGLSPIYVAHYLQKKPDITENGLNKLLELTTNTKRIIKEAANSISAGIFIAHGHSSIYGSDIQNWDEYPSVATKLPELRLPVDSFEHFCLLLEKDVSTINTAISRKQSDTLSLRPFEDDTEITLNPFNDINVIFGPKGTGKTKILEAIARYYSSNGVQASVFESAKEKLGDKFDIKGKRITKNLNPYGVNYCTDEIRRIKSAREADITNINNYVEYFISESGNKNAKKIKIKDFPAVGVTKPRNLFTEYKKAFEKIGEMIEFLGTNGPVAEVSREDRIKAIVSQLSELSVALKEQTWRHFADWKSIELTNSASRLFRDEVARKIGALTKPPETGFRQFAENRLIIKRDANEICKNIAMTIKDDVEAVGSLGPDKGELKCVTSFCFHDGVIRDSNFSPLKGPKKGSQANFAKIIKCIESSALSDDLFDHVSELNSNEDVDAIESVYELLLFWRRFTLADEVYTPSTGEHSMLSLHSELAEKKDVYILDEPERSLGNEYINDVIIPLINDKARQGKKVFISTHDANIAVRTLPYNSIYRCHDKGGYSTYVGNPFSNNLICQEDPSKILEWKKISMKTLEGGETAFGERGRIYGNN